MEKSKKQFIIFLIINFILWSCIQLMRNTISIDSMEAITWGELVSFGTNKHPPLSGWIMAGFYHLFNHWDFIVYAVGQLCILIGFIYTYKFAKFFLNDEKAVCSVMILEACFYYTYYIYVNSYNCNVLMMALWPMMIYYFYKSVKQNQMRDWIFYGLSVGFGFLAKYQTIFLLMAMGFYLFFDKKLFKQKGLYLSGVVAFLVVLPHIVWLFNNDFFSFAYMVERTQSATNNLPLLLVKLGHIFYPVKFLVGQILAVVSCILLYLIIAFFAKNISFKNEEITKLDKIFLLNIFFTPIILQGFMGFVTGNRVPSIWGSIMVGLTGVMLFCFLPVKFKENSFKNFVKLSYLTMLISLVVVGIFAVFQKKFFIAYPYQKIMPDFDRIWSEETDNSRLKYVGGNMELVFQFGFYDNQHPKVVLETFGHKNPWVNHDDILKSGILVVAKDEDDLKLRVKDLVYLLPEGYEISAKKYEYDVCNKLNQCDMNEFYYSVVFLNE